MDPYEGELSNKLGLYWTIACVYVGFPAAFVTLIVLSALGVL